MAVTVENSEMVLATAVFRVTDYAVTVESQERFITTAVSECFLNQIAVAGAGFVRYDCLQAMKKKSKLQCSRMLFPSLLSIKKNHLLKWQYEKPILGYALSFHVALAVDILKSKM